MAKKDQIDGALHEIASMVEFAHRSIEQMVADDTGTFHIRYDEINLLDFAIVDIDRRVKALRGGL